VLKRKPPGNPRGAGPKKTNIEKIVLKESSGNPRGAGPKKKKVFFEFKENHLESFETPKKNEKKPSEALQEQDQKKRNTIQKKRGIPENH
jgi:hypothetical protein